MRFFRYYVVYAVPASMIFSAIYAINSSEALSQLNKLAQLARDNQFASLLEARTVTERGQICTKNNTSVRREWGNLTAAERIAYTNAVLCFQKKSSLTPKALVPGARSRFDDFLGIHINQTVNIHYTGTFLAWHRYFIWSYEQALKSECGYTGAQPYWDWGLYSSDPAASPVFDGSATSMSGNGLVYQNGTGGGCVTSGPFKNLVVNLGPVPLPFAGTTKINGVGLGYNPRCLRRNINAAINERYANTSSIVNLIKQNQNIWDFEMTMQGFPGSAEWGVHRGGHYTIGGDPGSDPFASAGDPAFYLHHSMIDRVWWIWQNSDLTTRTNALSGTGTLSNNPASPNTTLETMIDIRYAGTSPILVADVMSTVKGPFCYSYS